MSRRAFLTVAITIFATLSVICSPYAGERPLQLIIPFSPGGATDTTGRIIASLLGKRFGIRVVVRNRPGAGGEVGFSLIATARPDGYTVGVITPALTTLRWRRGTDLFDRFTPIAMYNFDPVGLIVFRKSRYQSAVDLVQQIKSSKRITVVVRKKGTLSNYALTGFLRILRVSPDSVRRRFVRGSSDALRMLVSGKADFTTVIPGSGAERMIRSGQLSMLAVMATEPSQMFPKVPTLRDVTGINWAISSWRGIVGPKGLNEKRRYRLASRLGEIINDKKFIRLMNNRGFSAVYKGPREFAKFLKSEARRPFLGKRPIRRPSGKRPIRRRK